MRILYLFLLSIFSVSALAQNFDVKSFRSLPQDLDARVNYPELDQNGDKAALIKVVTTQTGFRFEGGMLGIVKTEQKTGEIWVYVPHGSRKITIKHAQLGVLRDYNFTEAIKEASVYEMVLVTGRVTTVVEEIQVAAQWLVITSEPAGATVYLDEKEVGQTPFNRKLKEGEYSYRVEYPRYYPEAGKIEISGEKKQLNIALNPKFGNVYVSSLPESGMDIFVDGKSTGKQTPASLSGIDSGKHRLTLQSQWYQNKTEMINVSDEETTEIEMTLLPTFANVNIQSSQGASILVDGAEKGVTKWSGRLMEGIYDVVATKQYHTEKQKQIEVIAGQDISLNLLLSEQTGSVDIISDPFGASIFVDGTAYGTTPNTVSDLLCGEHNLRLELANYAPVEKVFTIKHNKTISIEETMKDGELVSIDSKPQGAKVYLNGEYVGITPMNVSLGYGYAELRLVNGDIIKHKTIQVSERGDNQHFIDVRSRNEIQEDAAWDRALTNGTLESYQQYLSKYPKGIHAEEARNRLRIVMERVDDKLWMEAKKSNYISDYEGYLDRYPRGKHASEAHEILENSYYVLGIQAYDDKKYPTAINYLSKLQDNYSGGKHSDEVSTKLARARRRYSRNDVGFVNYTWQGNAGLGVGVGSLNLNKLGTYYTFTTNGNWWLYNAELAGVVNYTVEEMENGWWNDPVAQNVYKTSYLRTSLGITYGVTYPLWLYGGLGIQNKNRFDKYYLESSAEYAWAKNESFSELTVYPEIGVMSRIGKSWMVKYGLLFTTEGTYQEYGIALTF